MCRERYTAFIAIKSTQEKRYLTTPKGTKKKSMCCNPAMTTAPSGRAIMEKRKCKYCKKTMRLVQPWPDKPKFFICKPCKPNENGPTSYAEMV